MKTIRFRLLIAALVVTMGAAIARSQTADAPPMQGHAFGMRGPMGFFGKYLDLPRLIAFLRVPDPRERGEDISFAAPPNVDRHFARYMDAKTVYIAAAR